MKILIEKEIYNFVKESIQSELNDSDYKKILAGYLTAAIFTEEERLEDEIDSDMNLDVYSFDMSAMRKSYNDVKKFVQLVGMDAVKEIIDEVGYDGLGHDLWMTRNGHGVGFWEDSYEHEDQIMKAVKRLGSVDVYVTDKGELAFM